MTYESCDFSRESHCSKVRSSYSRGNVLVYRNPEMHRRCLVLPTMYAFYAMSE